MDFNKMITELRLTRSAKLLQVKWKSSQKVMPAGRLPFLAPEFITDVCQAIFLPLEVTQRAITVGQRIVANTALQALAWHYHYCLFCCTTYSEENISCWPSLTRILQDDGGTFYLLVLLSGLPRTWTIQRMRSIPSEIVRDTLSQVKSKVLDHHKEHGVWGLTPHYVRWLRNHLCGKLYCLGRLQFQFGFFKFKFRIFRHRTSRIVVALSEGGVCYLPDGQLYGSGRVHDTTNTWISQLTLTNDKIVGYPILPTGCALQKKVYLSRAEWREALSPGDPVLNIHIPKGGPLTFGLCGESFRAALKFFPHYFSDKPFVSFCCGSWLLDTQLEELLSPTSNIIRFQREFYLLPIHSNDLSLLNRRIFGYIPKDLTKAPRNTSLQRAILDHLLTGGHLHGGAGGGFIFPDDLNWDAQVYRRQKFPW